MDSPFDITYSIDTQTMACAPLNVPRILQMMEQHDVAITSKYCDANVERGQLMPAGGYIVYKKTEMVRLLVEEWKVEHLVHKGDVTPYDDQASLHYALRKTKLSGLSVGLIPQSMCLFVKKRSEDGTLKRRVTNVVSESVQLFHLIPPAAKALKDNICEQLNRNYEQARKLVQMTPIRYLAVAPNSTAYQC